MSLRKVCSSLRSAALCCAASWAAAGAADAQVKISQIYGGGGNTGSPYLSDYVELYNAGASPQSLAGWSVQYATAAGSLWSATALPSLSLAPGQYLLVKQVDGTAAPAGQSLALPTPQATGAINLSATDGKVALVNLLTALNVAAPNSVAQPQVVDLVGYGAATWNETAFFGGGFLAENNAPAGSNNNALFRAGCGGSDSDDNAIDFAVAAPNPRNSATALNAGMAAGVMCNPYFAEALQTVRVTAYPYLCGGAAAAATSVSLDAAAIGVGTVALNDAGTGGDVYAGDGIWSASVSVATGTSTGTKSMPLTFTDGMNGGGNYAALEVKATSTPDNDNCSSATAMSGAFPITAPGNFSGATCEYNTVLHANSATSSQSTRRGLWYTWTGTGNTMTFDTCGSPLIGGTTIPDTILMIFCGTCDGTTEIAFNDDNPTLCGAGAGIEHRSRVSFCTELGRTYYGWVGTFATGAQTFAITCRLDDDATPCTGAAPCGTCPPPTAAGAIAEDEPGYGPANDDGCDSTPNSFKTFAPTAYPTNSVFTGTARAYGRNRDADWYRFQAPSSDTLKATVTGQLPCVVELHALSPTGTCTGSTMVAASPLISQRCASTFLSSSVIAGDWYAVRVLPVGPEVNGGSVFGGYAVGGDSYHYLLEVELGGPPINDGCAGATALALGGSATGTTVLASNDGASSCDAIGRDVWYSLTTTAVGGLHIDTCGSAIDTAIALYDACGGSEIACNDDSVNCWCSGPASALDVGGLAIGTYRLRVSDKSIGAGGAFVVRARFDATAAGNDACCTAQALAVPSVTFGSTVGASAESPAPPACAGPLPGGAQAFGYTNGVWYTLAVPMTETVTLDTLASSYDSRLWVFNASLGCGSLSCVTANDDILGTTGQSKVSFVAQAGAEYRVLVAPSAGTGSFTLTATAAATPSNDDCATPQVLGGASGSIAGTTIGATAWLNTATSANPACQPATSYSMFDVWYEYTSPCSGNVTFSTCGGYDTILSVHSACPTTTLANQLAGACNLDGGGVCSPGSTLTVALSASETVLIRVAGEVGSAAGGNFTLSYAPSDADGDLTPDCFDGCPADPAKVAPGVCGCGVSDADTDGDLTPDCFDGCPADPTKVEPGVCGCGMRDVDTDGDLTLDCLDGCPADPAKQAPGQCGCGVADTDGDGDTVADCVDGCPTDPAKQAPGQCGCGFADVDSDGDTFADCVDGCPDDPAKHAAGQCGCGNADTDSDMDGTADCNDQCPLDPAKTAPGSCGCGVADADTDSDGILDCDDNCAAIANPGQEDCDLDGDGDACELAHGSASDLDVNGVPDNCQRGAIIPYCTAGTSVNGCTPTLTTVGTPSASQPSGFSVATSVNDGNRNGGFFYGVNGPHFTPFSAGFMCVRAPRQRSPVLLTGGTSGACDGALLIDVNVFAATHPSALAVPLTTGLTYYWEGYNRDSGSPNNLVMSDAVAVTFLP